MPSLKYQSCIDACLACAIQCESCATQCLNEDDVTMMTRCIELDRECAVICFATARLMAMDGENASMLCNLCAEMCDTCADECAKHDVDHCQQCAQECRRCADVCREMMAHPV